jgi:hypothetical protein
MRAHTPIPTVRSPNSPGICTDTKPLRLPIKWELEAVAGMEAKNQAETNVISPQIEALVFLLNLKMG